MSEAYQLTHQPSGQTVAQVRRANGWWAKGMGLIGQASLPPQTGLWLPGVASVHTCLMRFPLDLLFLDADFRALRLAAYVPPGRLLIGARGAHHTVELAAGSLVGRVGDLWELRPVERPR